MSAIIENITHKIFVTNRPLCNYLLACQPVEACLEGNKCAEGYISYYAPYSASGKCQPGSVTLPENLELALSMVIGGEESSTDTSRSMNSSITLSSLKCFVPRCGMCNPETHFRLEGECTKCPDQMVDASHLSFFGHFRWTGYVFFDQIWC